MGFKRLWLYAVNAANLLQDYAPKNFFGVYQLGAYFHFFGHLFFVKIYALIVMGEDFLVCIIAAVFLLGVCHTSCAVLAHANAVTPAVNGKYKVTHYGVLKLCGYSEDDSRVRGVDRAVKIRVGVL